MSIEDLDWFRHLSPGVRRAYRRTHFERTGAGEEHRAWDVVAMLWHHRIAQWQIRGMSQERAGELVGSIKHAERVRLRERVPAWGRSAPLLPDFDKLARVRLPFAGGLNRDAQRLVHRIMRGRWAGRTVKAITRELNTGRAWDPIWRRWHEEVIEQHTEDEVLAIIARFHLPSRTDWLRARIKRLHARGLDRQQTIDRLPASRHLARLLVDEQGLRFAERKTRSLKTDKARLARVRKFRNQGLTWRAVAGELGISTQALHEWRRRHLGP